MAVGLSSSRRPHRILTVDSDRGLLETAERVLREARFAQRTAADIASALQELERWSPDLVIVPQHLPDGEGVDLISLVLTRDRHVPILFCPDADQAEAAIESIKRGAFDCLWKPLSAEQLAARIDHALESRQLLRTPAVMQSAATEEPLEDDRLIGRCPAMQRVYQAIGRIAMHDLSALIRGEPGTGKRLVARALHRHGSRADRPLHTLCCVDTASESLHRQLLGSDGHSGMLQRCAGETLLIEEVAAAPRSLQTALWESVRSGRRALNGGRSDRGVTLLLTTSERNPATATRLHPGLYYELRGSCIDLPPLHNRGDDLQLLVHEYVRRLSHFDANGSSQPLRVSEEAMQWLAAFSWPGNVAELRSVLRRALLEGRGTVLADPYLRAALAPDVAGDSPKSSPAVDSPPSVDFPHAAVDEDADRHDSRDDGDLYAQALEQMERRLLADVLQRTGGNLARSARLLGITRVSLRRKIQHWQIEIPGRGVLSDGRY